MPVNLNTSAAAVGEKQQEGYVVEIPMPDECTDEAVQV